VTGSLRGRTEIRIALWQLSILPIADITQVAITLNVIVDNCAAG
jgi:hypothetical protein